MQTQHSSSPGPQELYHKAAAVFEAICDLPEDHRGAQLSKSCGDDATLRREVESLLAHHRPSTTNARPATSTGAVRWDPFRVFRGPLGIALLGLGALGLLGAARVWTVTGLETTLLDTRVRDLRASLERRVAAIEVWKARQQDRFRSLSAYPELVRHAQELVALTQRSTDLAKDLAASPAHASLKEFLARVPKDIAGVGYGLVSGTGTILSSEDDRLLGKPGSPASGELIRRALLGEVYLLKPYRHRAYVSGVPPERKDPVQMLIGPILDAEGKTVALLALLFDASQTFTSFFDGSAGTSTRETFAFDDQGLLLTDLPDAGRLKSLGLAPEGKTALSLRLRDPGGDLLAGHKPPANADEWPMTRLSLAAESKKPGQDARGYRNVRGRTVIGAWTWLPDWNMGLGLEMERAEVLLPAGRVRILFDVLFAVAGLGTIGLLGFSRRFGLYRRVSEKGSAGTYVLDHRIGAGGTSEVFLAHHAHLKRPMAVKILNVKGAGAQAVARFEREAMVASRLSHPNTVQIHDYGRTRDGRFYLAMEYIEGLTLAQLVALGGPLEPARAIHLLDQICGSLQEAHAAGLVHRDIKPANVMVCRLGGVFDVVKVLDFGIARDQDVRDTDMTGPNQLAGTPLYIAPERIRSPRSADPRSDLYSLGALAYHLLAGREVFDGPGPAEILYQVLSVDPTPPSQLRRSPLPPDLEKLILDLLAKDPEARPASAAAVREVLSSLEIPERWDQRDARAWWTDHDTRILRLAPPATKPA